jgi:translation elongation factor EF-Ts
MTTATARLRAELVADEATDLDVLTEKVAKIGENIQVRRFIRYQLGA